MKRGKTAVRVECRSRLPFARAALRRAIERLLEGEGRPGAALTVALVGDGEIRRLHRDFLGHDSATDCLSFPLAEGPDDPELGEVYVSLDTARREAARRGIAFEREVTLYAVHGALHLVGYDDRTAAARKRMRAAEARWAGLAGE